MAKYKDYTGKTMYSNHNVLYNTQLPVALFVPSAIGKNSVQSNPSSYLPTKKFSKTLFTGSAFAGVDIGLDYIGTVNLGAIDATVAYESAGFNMGQPIYTTQRMLVSHLSDTDGETWTSIFGNAPSATTEEMSQNELVRNLAEKRYGNSEWLANIAKLSTKGLFTEYLIQEAEINRLLGLIMELRQQQMQQEAILSRVMLDGKDKAIENLTEMIAVNAPTFMNARLEKSGDEWHEEQVVTGYEGGDGYLGSAGSLEFATTPVPKGFTPEKAKIIKEVALRLGIEPNHLAAVISFETGGTFSPSKENPTSSAVGLIQFMQYTDGTSHGSSSRWDYWGMTRKQFGSLSFEAQMKFVEKYYKDRKFSPNKKATLGQTYTAVTGCCYKAGSKAYAKNKVWDANKDGYISRDEAVTAPVFKAHVRDYFKNFKD